MEKVRLDGEGSCWQEIVFKQTAEEEQPFDDVLFARELQNLYDAEGEDTSLFYFPSEGTVPRLNYRSKPETKDEEDEDKDYLSFDCLSIVSIFHSVLCQLSSSMGIIDSNSDSAGADENRMYKEDSASRNKKGFSQGGVIEVDGDKVEEEEEDSLESAPIGDIELKKRTATKKSR